MRNRVHTLIGWVHHHVFELNFYRVHLVYFIISILVSSAVFWASNTDGLYVHYTDALVMCTSAMTNCGLTTIDLGAVNAYQQSILFVLMMLGDISIVSISVVVVRRYFFNRKIHTLLKHSKAARRLAQDIDEQRGERQALLKDERTPNSTSSSGVDVSGRGVDNCADGSKATRQRSQEHTSNQQRQQRSATSTTRTRGTHHGYGGWSAPWETDAFYRLITSPFRSLHRGPAPDHHYLSFPPSLDHKGRFRNLTRAQLEELGGVEYRALCVLTWILPSYTLVWLCFTWTILIPYTTKSSAASIIRNTQPGDTSPQWWAVFAGLSAYSNTGLSLLNQNMIPLRHDYPILIITGVAILAGNTFYPIFLRLSVWALSKVVPKHSELHHSLAFLLHHPRRCFLFLFPAKNTWYLLGVQLGIFLLVWLAFEVLNLGYSPLISDISDAGQLVMNGLYQTTGVRSSGYYITNQSNLSPACQVFFMINMYISAIPLIISLRSTNIYEERSIGINHSTQQKKPHHDENDKDNPTIQTHLQTQLAYDLWWMTLAVFLISIIERGALSTTAPGYSLFSIIFEVVSGYGSVGLSLGLPDDRTTSFSGAWQPLSKLVLVSVMLRGRHRILPLAIDRAVLLPGQELMEKIDHEEEMLSDPEDRDELCHDYEHRIRMEERGGQAEHGGRQDPEASRVSK